MKKRLISLLVALCMAVTLLPVSAITAWAEEGRQLKIVDGYPEGSIDANRTHTTSCSGEGWSYDGAKLLTCILPARQITIFPNLFLVEETSLHALSKLVKKPQLQMGAL